MNKKIILTTSLIIASLTCSLAQALPDSSALHQFKNLNATITNADSDIEELKGLDNKMAGYMKKWDLQGMSLAITRNDSLVYAKGYGWADKEKGIKMEPGHIMRVASVSKLITAIGIMVLQDQIMLNILGPVFGPKGILKGPLYTSLIKDPNYNKITIEHILRHQAGFESDPVFSPRSVRAKLGLDAPPTAEDFFRYILSKDLKFTPGSENKYSNLGYLLLCEIIETVSGMEYEEFIQEKVLKPAGCYDMHIAGNYYKDKRENEVRYYAYAGNDQFVTDYSGNGKVVHRCYGGNNITMLSGAGGWCASPIELARLVAAIDGDPTIMDIISQRAIHQMTEYNEDSIYAIGWNDIVPDEGWGRSGTLSGTCAFIKRFNDGECWILVTNTSTSVGALHSQKTNAFFKECRELYSEKLPAVDLFK